jgi:hypothetical protein
MPCWLVYMETYGIDFLTPSLVIYISKHHHHHQGISAPTLRISLEERTELNKLNL